VRGTLFAPAFVVYRDITRQAKVLHCLKYVGALKRGLAYLSRCNSGWFCHSAHDSSPGRPERHSRAEDADGHEDERDAVDALAAKPVTKVAEGELPHERTDQRDADHHVVDSHGLPAWPVLGLILLAFEVEAAEQSGHRGDAEQVVGPREEAHADVAIALRQRRS
jgi:hypothetical protein